MGMFDEIRVECPDCRGTFHIQSKGAADPLLRVFDQHSVPTSVASYVDGDVETCRHCDTSWKVVTEVPDRVRVRLYPLLDDYRDCFD